MSGGERKCESMERGMKGGSSPISGEDVESFEHNRDRAGAIVNHKMTFSD